jgi:hypothetical protein
MFAKIDMDMERIENKIFVQKKCLEIKGLESSDYKVFSKRVANLKKELATLMEIRSRSFFPISE